MCDDLRVHTYVYEEACVKLCTENGVTIKKCTSS